MYIENYSNSDLVINYKERVKTLKAKKITLVDEIWISFETIRNMFGGHVGLTNTPSEEDVFLFDNQILVQENQIYKVEAIEGIVSMYVRNGNATLYFDNDNTPSKLSELVPVNDFVRVSGSATIPRMKDYFAVITDNNAQIIFNNIKVSEVETTVDTPQEPGTGSGDISPDDLNELETKIDGKLNTKADKTSVYTKEQVDAKISSAFKYCGSVDSFSALPTEGLETGDVYNTSDDGANYVWNGSAWDKLSETFDLTKYATKDELANKADKTALSAYATTSAMNSALANKADTSALATKADKTALDAKADKTALSVYATTEAMNSALDAKADKTALSTYATKTELAGKADTSALSAYATKTELAGKADTSALEAKADKTALSAYATTSAMNSALAGKQNTITGNKGEALFYSGTSVVSQALLKEELVSNTAEDLELCKQQVPADGAIATTFIYDLQSNQVLQYNKEATTWEVKAGANIVDTLGVGRFAFNRQTNKLFFCLGDEVLHVASV